MSAAKGTNWRRSNAVRGPHQCPPRAPACSSGNSVFYRKRLSGAYHNEFTKPIPGTLQEGGASFQTTHWTVVLQARQTESEESAHQALSGFCEAYWPPL